MTTGKSKPQGEEQVFKNLKKLNKVHKQLKNNCKNSMEQVLFLQPSYR